MGVVMCLESWGLIGEEGDDDEESEDEDICKDILGTMESDEINNEFVALIYRYMYIFCFVPTPVRHRYSLRTSR